MASKEMEMQVTIMKKMLKQGGVPIFDEVINPEILRTTIETAQANMPNEPGVTFIPEKFGQMDAELSMPEQAREDAIIIYIHGGGLICGNAKTSRGYASMLAGETKLPVYAFSYRLVPEDPFPAAVDDCLEAYKMISEEYPNRSLFLIGESGGAYLSVVTALKARDNGLKKPSGVISYSVPIDWSNALNRIREGNKDFTVTPGGIRTLSQMYVTDEKDRKNPYASPYYADFKDFPPTFVVWDESETLAIDSEILVSKLEEANVEVKVKSYPDCFHAFPTTGRGTPESAEVLKDTVSFIEINIG